MLGGEADVLVKVESRQLRKVEPRLLVSFYETIIEPFRRSTCRKSKGAIGFLTDLLNDDFGCPVAELLVIVNYLDKNRKVCSLGRARGGRLPTEDFLARTPC